jgi:hypothetical protein
MEKIVLDEILGRSLGHGDETRPSTAPKCTPPAEKAVAEDTLSTVWFAQTPCNIRVKEFESMDKIHRCKGEGHTDGPPT